MKLLPSSNDSEQTFSNYRSKFSETELVVQKMCQNSRELTVVNMIADDVTMRYG